MAFTDLHTIADDFAELSAWQLHEAVYAADAWLDRERARKREYMSTVSRAKKRGWDASYRSAHPEQTRQRNRERVRRYERRIVESAEFVAAREAWRERKRCTRN